VTDFRPDWTVHPGETLRETLAERGMTQAALAAKLGVSPATVSHIVTGYRGIGIQTALRLEKALGINARFWMNLQAGYDLHCARKAQS
jgi:addiction module HigA family antidote